MQAGEDAELTVQVGDAPAQIHAFVDNARLAYRAGHADANADDVLIGDVLPRQKFLHGSGDVR